MDRDDMRVLQLIDSLDAGGAERMSINLANALHRAGVSSHLCATRRGGPLAEALDPEVPLLILEKRSALDPAALRRLVRYVRENRIGIIHAHSSSYATALLCRLFTGVKVIWHDHNGQRADISSCKNFPIQLGSVFFDAAIPVNETLAEWGRNKLFINRENILLLPNFVLKTEGKYIVEDLPGNHENRIVSVANLRWQKDHITLIHAFHQATKRFPHWHLFLVGEERNDSYSRELRALVQQLGIGEKIHFLGRRADVSSLLAASTIGVLSSISEGLPISLLEYGLSGLPVVCTDVGQCAEVLGEGKYGLIVPPGNPSALAEALGSLMEAPQRRRKLGEAFRRQVEERYSQKAVVKQLLELYQRVSHAR